MAKEKDKKEDPVDDLILVHYNGKAKRDVFGFSWKEGDTHAISKNFKHAIDEQMQNIEGKGKGFYIGKATKSEIKEVVAEDTATEK